MYHEVFGGITYDPDDVQWSGRVALPLFAEYGREPCDLPDAEDDDFRRGAFPLTIRDYAGAGPTPQQMNSFRYLVEHEAEACRVVMATLFESYREMNGMEWLKRYENSRFFGGIARWLLAGVYETPEAMKPGARCTGVEISDRADGEYAYMGFQFNAVWEVEHGLSVVYHPVQEAYWGDGGALDA